MIILSNYLQKLIIKLICNFINKKNKKLLLCSIQEFEKDNEIIKKLIFNISFVSKDWFLIVSNNIKTIGDVNCLFNISKEWSIFKKNNIESIRILDNQLLELLKLNKLIEEKSMENLKKIKIINSLSSPLFLSYISKLKFSNIKIQFLNLNDLNDEYLKMFDINNIKSIFFLRVDNCSNIINVFKNLKPFKSIPKHIEVVSLFNRFPYKQLFYDNEFNLNKTQSLKTFKSTNEDITIEELYYILSSSPNLKFLNIDLCLNKLDFYLNKQQQQQQFYPSLECNCNSIIYNDNEDEKTFLFYWELLKDQFQYHKNLNSLRINNKCSTENYNENLISDSSIPIIACLISNNKSIKTLKIINFNSLNLLKFILLNNDTIIHYSIRLLNTNSYPLNYFKNDINEINEIITSNNNLKISTFKIKIIQVNQNGITNKEVLYNITKN
ncbi:hypothetical protein ACTFIW_012951 [Dictyostelium discoideum]